MKKNMRDIVDYYKILQVSRNANEDELKKAYKNLAMKWHPDKNNGSPMKIKEAEAKFKQIKEAFEILANPTKRKIYDDSQTDPFNNNNNYYYYYYKANTTNTTATTMRRKHMAFGVGSNHQYPVNFEKAKDMKPLASEHKLVLSLEDLYKGCQKRLRISRNVVDDLGNMMIVDEILEIEVKPGWRKDTKIIFPGKGNQVPGSSCPGDLVFLVEEKPHRIFKREGNDLVTTQKISLSEALTGKTIKVTTLDGKEIEICVTGIVVKPDTEIMIHGEGMPSITKPGKKGNLRINFDIIFPSSQLTASQKCELKKIFGEVHNN